VGLLEVRREERRGREGIVEEENAFRLFLEF